MGSPRKIRGRLSRRMWITALGLVLVLAVGTVGYAVLRATPRQMVIGVHVGPQVAWAPEDLVLFPMLANGNAWDQVIRRLVYSGLYRVDDEMAPVEDLAARACTWTDDLLVIRCDIRAARFHDGSSLTADDVAFTYELQASDECRRSFTCLKVLDEAIAVDADTVEFRLHKPDATFVTFTLADTLIESKRRITDSYDAFRAAAVTADSNDLAARSEALSTAAATEGADCDRLLPDATSAVLDLGLTPWSRDEFGLGPNGRFEPCAEAAYLARVLGDAAASLRLDGLDAIAAAYRILDVHGHPVGTGPWRVEEIVPGRSMTLAAFDLFHRGRPASPQVVVRLVRSGQEAAEAVRRGEVDWLVQPFALEDPNFLIDALGGVGERDLVFNEYAYDFYIALFYNLRKGRLFAELDLRKALELCINKPETVAAATRDRGIPIQASVMPGHWAFDENLKPPAKDVPAAKRLIESAGWTLASDDVYERDGRRLAATVPVHANSHERLKFMQLVADQVAECGIELRPVEVPFDDFNLALSWPHLFPGEDEQWDVMFHGNILVPDPGQDWETFACRSRPTPANPDLNNATGYCNPETDAVLAQALATYDVRERARLYRRHQQIIAEQRPMLFGWAPRFVEVRSEDLTSTAGPLSTRSQTWWWQLETLAVMR